jgi:hypothetical protein
VQYFAPQRAGAALGYLCFLRYGPKGCNAILPERVGWGTLDVWLVTVDERGNAGIRSVVYLERFPLERESFE